MYEISLKGRFMQLLDTNFTRSVMAIRARTKSRGYVHVTDADPAAQPAMKRRNRTPKTDLDKVKRVNIFIYDKNIDHFNINLTLICL